MSRREGSIPTSPASHSSLPPHLPAGFSVSRAIQLNLPKFMPEIEEVSEYASKEYSLERTLDKMQGDWSGMRFDYMDWRNTGEGTFEVSEHVWERGRCRGKGGRI